MKEGNIKKYEGSEFIQLMSYVVNSILYVITAFHYRSHLLMLHCGKH